MILQLKCVGEDCRISCLLCFLLNLHMFVNCSPDPEVRGRLVQPHLNVCRKLVAYFVMCTSKTANRNTDAPSVCMIASLNDTNDKPAHILTEASVSRPEGEIYAFQCTISCKLP